VTDIVCKLPNGCTLYRESNGVGGHRYWSDEIGGGVMLWDTSLVDATTLLTAIVEEQKRYIGAWMIKPVIFPLYNCPHALAARRPTVEG
jgi:hypothetical protein